MSAESFAVAERVAWLDQDSPDGPVVYATTLPDGPPIVLRGTGGVIFLAAAEGGSLETLLDRVGEAADVEPDDVRADVVAFVDELVLLGLVARR